MNGLFCEVTITKPLYVDKWKTMKFMLKRRKVKKKNENFPVRCLCPVQHEYERSDTYSDL